MKLDFVKNFKTKRTYYTFGIALYDWAIPLHIEVNVWPNSEESLLIIITLICFYFTYTLKKEDSSRETHDAG